jgi:GNAT superfamily N-acetyltransferase
MLEIRPASVADSDILVGLIRELADYERLSQEVTGDTELLREHLFGPRPAAEAALAELDGAPIGFALWFTTFSTFLCRPGLWLEDLFVRPQHRRAGAGRALLGHVAAIAVSRGCGRLEWAVLDWNAPALDFYRSLGARSLDQWTIHRVDGDALARLAYGQRGDAAPMSPEA